MTNIYIIICTCLQFRIRIQFQKFNLKKKRLFLVSYNGNYLASKLPRNDWKWRDDWSSQQNCCIWGTENQHAYIEKPTHPTGVTVWCGFWSKGIIGLFFFENEQREAVTVNGVRYRALLNEFLFTKIEEEDIGNIYFQREGATCHTAEGTLTPCFWRSHYQPQSWDRLVISDLWFRLFVGCRQR